MKKFFLVVIIAVAIFLVYRRVNAPEEQRTLPPLPAAEQGNDEPAAPASGSTDAAPAPTAPTETPAEAPVSEPTGVLDGPGPTDVPIWVDAPAMNTEVQSPLTISGQTTLSVDTLYLEVRNLNGTVLIAEPIRVKVGADGARTFSITIGYSFTTTKAGTVQVYAKTAETPRMVIPVTFQ
jgi:hypothetical protein